MAATVLQTAISPPFVRSSTALADGLRRDAPHWICGRSENFSSLIDQSPFQSPPQTSPFRLALVPSTFQKCGLASHFRLAQIMSTAKP